LCGLCFCDPVLSITLPVRGESLQQVVFNSGVAVIVRTGAGMVSCLLASSAPTRSDAVDEWIADRAG
jgi:hypothetical protein